MHKTVKRDNIDNIENGENIEEKKDQSTSYPRQRFQTLQDIFFGREEVFYANCDNNQTNLVVNIQTQMENEDKKIENDDNIISGDNNSTSDDGLESLTFAGVYITNKEQYESYKIPDRISYMFNFHKYGYQDGSGQLELNCGNNYWDFIEMVKLIKIYQKLGIDCTKSGPIKNHTIQKQIDQGLQMITDVHKKGNIYQLARLDVNRIRIPETIEENSENTVHNRSNMDDTMIQLFRIFNQGYNTSVYQNLYQLNKIFEIETFGIGRIFLTSTKYDSIYSDITDEMATQHGNKYGITDHDASNVQDDIDQDVNGIDSIQQIPSIPIKLKLRKPAYESKHVKIKNYYKIKWYKKIQPLLFEALYLCLFLVNVSEYFIIFYKLNQLSDEASKNGDSWFNYQCLNLILWRNGNIKDLIIGAIVLATSQHAIRRAKWSRLHYVTFMFRFVYLLLLIPSILTHFIVWAIIFAIVWVFMTVGPLTLGLPVAMLCEEKFKHTSLGECADKMFWCFIWIGVIGEIFASGALFPHDKFVYQISYFYDGNDWWKTFLFFFQFRSVEKWWKQIIVQNWDDLINLRSLDSVFDFIQFIHRWL